MNEHEDPQLTRWLANGPNHGPSASLEAALVESSSTRQRPAWLVNLTGGTISKRPAIVPPYVARSFAYVLVAALLVGLLVGTLVAGGVLRRPLPQQPVASLPAAVSNPTPVASVVPAETPAPSAIASEIPSTGLVAYTVGNCSIGELPVPTCTSTAWLAGGDGSGARALDGNYQALGWSADGSWLLLGETSVVVANREGAGGIGLVLTNAKGSPVTTVPTSALCTFPCTMADYFTLSPDGRRVAFVRGYDNDHGSSLIAILDLSTGDVTELSATRVTNPPDIQNCHKLKTCEGDDGFPAWSPDGKQIVFERQGMSPEPGATWTSAALYVVDADGSNFRRVTPTGLYAHDPSWSPDGTRLVFSNTEFVVNAAHTRVLDMPSDIYTINVDGTGLTQLTQDGISALPNWTANGRVVFARDASPDENTAQEHWIMDADGANQSRLGDSLAELTAAGCTTCFYGSHINGPARAYWQPTR